MHTSLPDQWLRQTAAVAIAGYQKHLSPRKGFSCAHRLLHGGESCSQYTKRAILEQGLLVSIPAIQQRFQACKAANQVLQAQRQPPRRDPNPPPESQPDRCAVDANDCTALDGCADCTVGLTELDCSQLDCGLTDAASCDRFEGCGDCSSGADCSGLDCSGCDCSGADCGSCGG